MKKRILSILLALCFAASALTGCSSSNNATSTASANAASASKAPDSQGSTSSSGDIGGSLVIWEHTPQFEPALKAVIAGFNEKHPNVKIEYQIKTSDQYYNLLATTIQAGETPDLFWTNGNATSNLPAYVAQGVVMDLTNKVDFSLFNDKMMKIVTLDGKLYASPTVEVGGRAVFYNKDIFKTNGISVPTKFSEFEADLAKLHSAGILPISFSAKDPWATLFHFEPVLAAMSLDWLQASEKGTVAVNDPKVIAAYDKMLEWAKKGYYGPGYTGVDEGGALLAFSKGQAAMCIEGTWNVDTIQKNNPRLNFGAFQLPTEDGKRPFVGTSSCGFSVSASTKNPNAALAFENYFASLDGQTKWVDTLNAIPGVTKIKSKNPIINEISQYDLMAASYYDILGAQAAKGENPGKLWEEDQTKVMSKGITPKAFTDELQAKMKK